MRVLTTAPGYAVPKRRLGKDCRCRTVEDKKKITADIVETFWSCTSGK
jgi:hypothetical protein